MADVPMTRFVLIRHGAHLLGPGRIAGRAPGIHLSPEGHAQVAAMVERVGHLPIRAIYASPVDRARETAEPLAHRLGLPVQTREALAEIDFGQWTGLTLDELRPKPAWKQWNAFRSGGCCPGGESMLAVQARIVAEMLRLRQEHPDDAIALVTHGDVIRAALAYCLGTPLDLFQRVEISLASITVIGLAEYGPWVLCVNHTDRIELA